MAVHKPSPTTRRASYLKVGSVRFDEWCEQSNVVCSHLASDKHPSAKYRNYYHTFEHVCSPNGVTSRTWCVRVRLAHITLRAEVENPAWMSNVCVSPTELYRTSNNRHASKPCSGTDSRQHGVELGIRRDGGGSIPARDHSVVDWRILAEPLRGRKTMS